MCIYVNSAMSIISPAISKLYEDGMISLIEAFPRFIQRSTNYWIDRNILFKTVSEPYKLIHVDPNEIDLLLTKSPATDWDSIDKRPAEVHSIFDMERSSFFPQRNIGRILSGDWDKHTKPFESNFIYQSLRSHFVEGAPWEQTELVKRCIGRIEKGYESYGYASADGFLENRLDYLDELYHDIEKNGYLSQSEVTPDHRTGNIFHEVNINIGRNGELIFNNTSGNNRLAMAKILDINQIPVIVIVRHSLWEDKKRKILEDGSTVSNVIIEDRNQFRDHPDIRPYL